jgi:hypothetical protein
MSTETVSVGCRLPNGLKLEVGFSVSQKGNGGAPFAMVTKAENYASHILRGTNQSLIVRDPQTRKPVAVLPNQLNREPFINHGVPKEFWERWCKDNAKSWHLTSGQIFFVPKADESTAKAATMDAKAKSGAIFEPLDPSKKMQLENNVLTKREDEE